MKRIHPNVSCAATCATFALALGLSGCRSSSSGIAGNPFMAPDRVPPPTTRALLPGQAQPYYPGDPLPALQSAASRPANAVVANPAEADARSSTGRTLDWNQPGSAAPAPPTAPPERQIVSANEGSVAVPADADPLRFALPAPHNPENAAPISAAPPAPISPPIQPPASQPPPGVLLASYTAPVASSPHPPISAPAMAAPQQVSSPWRAPQIVQPAAAPMYAAQPVALQPQYVEPIVLPAPPMSPAVQPQVAAPTNTMGVTLRAVASPPPEPGDPMPRVRVPGYIEPPQVSAADGFRPRTSMQ